MSKIFIDAGTSWSKIVELYDNKEDLSLSPLKNIIDKYSPVIEYKKIPDNMDNSQSARFFLLSSNIIVKENILFDKATGHMVKNHIKPDGYYENEVIALAYGAKKILKNIDNAVIVDLGSRDAKWIKFENQKYKDLDWNNNCGSATGATVEMLCKFYNVDPSEISVQKERFPVTCGVFGMEKIMDAIASDIPAEIAIAKYIHGIAYNTWKFARQPEKIYLSGGFCLNKCFVDSLKLYCEVILLGRYVLLKGLSATE